LPGCPPRRRLGCISPSIELLRFPIEKGKESQEIDRIYRIDRMERDALIFTNAHECKEMRCKPQMNTDSHRF
jgi:hypothetical protein